MGYVFPTHGKETNLRIVEAHVVTIERVEFPKVAQPVKDKNVKEDATRSNF